MFVINQTQKRLSACDATRSRRAFNSAALLLLAVLLLPHAVVSSPQKKKSTPAPPTPAASPALTRTTTRHEVRRFGYGGALVIYGAPQGSITVEAWAKNEIDVTANIELRASTEEELTRLAAVNGFVFDAQPNRIEILTTGTHDRKYMKRVARDFPKHLLALPWKIDYRIRVPVALELEISAGRGALNVSGVEGAIRLSAGESAAALTLTGGDVTVTIERGTIDVNIVARSWRGRGAEIRLAGGDLNVTLPANANADINAEVLRTGRVENTHPALAARDENAPVSERSQHLRAGAGGATLNFTVGDGTLRIKQENGKQ